MAPRDISKLVTPEQEPWSTWLIERTTPAGETTTVAAAGDRVASNWVVSQGCAISLNRLAGWPRTVATDGATTWSDLTDGDANTYRIVPATGPPADRESPGRHCWGNATVADATPTAVGL